jgi:hypothetical protein
MRRACCQFLLCFALLVVLSGCAEPSSSTDVAPPNGGSTADAAATPTAEFDFGPTLALGKSLEHRFTLSNPTGRAIRLARATSSTPCCSAISPLPRSVPAGGRVQVPIVLRTRNRTGPLRVIFEVESDSPDRIVWRFIVSARLIPSWEIRASEECIATLPLGQAGNQIYRVCCRRKGAEGCGPPERLKADAPLKADFTGPVAETRFPDGIIETTRDVVVTLPKSLKAGSQRHELFFHWANGETQRQIISWEVAPCVTVTPMGFVLRPSKEPFALALTVSSEERPIRILEVSGPLLAKAFKCPSDAKRVHLLCPLVDTSKIDAMTVPDISITTDHPDQPVVSVPVLLTAQEPGESQ